MKAILESFLEKIQTTMATKKEVVKERGEKVAEKMAELAQLKQLVACAQEDHEILRELADKFIQKLDEMDGR